MDGLGPARRCLVPPAVGTVVEGALRILVGALAGLPATVSLLSVLAWSRWGAIPLRSIALEVSLSSPELYVSLIPAAITGAGNSRRSVRFRAACGLAAGLLMAAPGTALVTGRSLPQVLQAARSRTLDFCILAASYAVGGAVAAIGAGAVAYTRH